MLVDARRTAPITWATVAEVSGIVGLLVLSIHFLDLVGATAAAISIVGGRLLANIYLIRPCVRTRTRPATSPRSTSR